MSTVAGFRISQPIEKVFPLFSAEGEKLWVPGWDYENIMGYTDLHEDNIFLTTNHDHAPAKVIWLVKQYRPETHCVQFYKVEPGNKVGIVTVQCTKVNESSTNVEASYEYIGLSPKADAFIEKFTAAEYKAFIGEWDSLLTHYFETLA